MVYLIDNICDPENKLIPNIVKNNTKSYITATNKRK